MGLCLFAYAQEADELASVRHYSDYPVTASNWVAVDNGKVVSSQLEYFRAPYELQVTVHKPHLATLKAGDHWGTIDEEKVELDRRSIEIEKWRLKNDLKELEGKQKQRKESIEIEIATLLSEKALITKGLNSDELPSKLALRVKEAIKLLDESVIELRESIAEEVLLEEYQNEKDALEIKLQRRERELEKSERNALLKAPFDGILELNNDVDENAYWVDSGEVIATISDDSVYEVHFDSKNSVFQRSNLSKLRITMNMGSSGQLIIAHYKETKKIDINGTFRNTHIFGVDDESIDLASQIVDQTRVCNIHEKLPPNCHLVKKHDIALVAPDILNAKGWNGLVKYLWPDAEVISIGPRAISIQKSDAN